VINWTLRLGLGLLQQVTPCTEPWIAIIDHSIDIGTKKALVVLRVTTDALLKRKQAICLKDCECVGLSISETVNGESIAKELDSIFEKAGTPAAVLKDCDRTLNKGVTLWADHHGATLYIVDDLGHVMASALKTQYEKTAEYTNFTSLLSNGAKKLRQTDLAFITPPKLRAKGRFQSIGKVGDWAAKLLTVLQQKLVGQEDSLGHTLARIKEAFPDFVQCSSFVEDFANTTDTLSQVMKILKNKGLDQTTLDQCQDISEQFPKDSLVRQRLSIWLQQHILVQEKIAPLPLLVSSDIIESLFGKFKHILHRSPHADMNRTALLLPALCGEMDAAIVTRAFQHADHHDLESWEEENIPYTVRKKRQQFFSEKPNTGELLAAE